jgi:transcriptional regulator with XRE-family HTH domain
MNNIGLNIKKLRIKHMWSQDDVAAYLNLSTSAYNKIETGSADISISRLAEIARIFHTSPARILSEEEEEESKLKYNTDINKLNAFISKKEDECINLQRKVIQLYDELRKK